MNSAIPKPRVSGGFWLWIHIRIMVVFDLRHVLPCMFKPWGPSDLMKQLDRFRRRLTSESMSGQSAILNTNNRGCVFYACLLRRRMSAKSDYFYIVPMSYQVMALFKSLNPITGLYPLVFIGRNDRTKPISKESINQVIELLGCKGRLTGMVFVTQ